MKFAQTDAQSGGPDYLAQNNLSWREVSSILHATLHTCCVQNAKETQQALSRRSSFVPHKGCIMGTKHLNYVQFITDDKSSSCEFMTFVGHLLAHSESKF